ncbi:4Fe-4S dicluster domain-containing protein [bacterium]|nr:4Fe-4S dicluster domain-containing protein [bacterium]
MKVIKISTQNWSEGIAKLRNEYRLYAPVKKGTGSQIKELKPEENPDLSLKLSRFSPKSVVFPQSQIMFTYSLDENDKDYNLLKEVKVDSTPRVVIGLKPCDASSFGIVKRNYDNPDYQDSYWMDSYNSLTLVGCACDEPAATCFCLSVGGGPYNETGLDLLLITVEDGYLVKVITDKGKNLVKIAGWTEETDFDQFENRQKAAEEKITSEIQTDRLKELEVNDLFNAPIWEEMAFSCLNCGTCTYSCPTCWCFDIQDETRGKSGIRMRNWDSCMYPLFTLEGSGHNPRTEKLQRVRQRFMHKLKYYADKYDSGIQCVGCGRCINLCPVNIDIRVVCEKMNDYQTVNQ